MKNLFRVIGLWALVLASLSAVAGKGPKSSKKDEVVTISTAQGDIRLILFDATPVHKANFLKKAQSGYYNGTTFHRIIPDFMIQGGDPNSKDADPLNDGMGPDGEQTIPAEIKPELSHKFGAVAAARQSDFVNPTKASSPAQFYIVQNHNGVPHLNNNYTVFGQVISGLEVLDKIAQQSRDERDRPLTNITMTVKVEKLKKKKITELYGYTY